MVNDVESRLTRHCETVTEGAGQFRAYCKIDRKRGGAESLTEAVKPPFRAFDIRCVSTVVRVNTPDLIARSDGDEC